MPLISDAFWLRLDFWLLLAIPALAAALGGFGNWLSLRLLFGPLPLVGDGRSILEARAEVVADRFAVGLSRLLRLSDLFRVMEPERIAGYVSDAVMDRLDDYIDDIMAEKYSVLWDNLPVLVRQRVYARVERELPSILDNLIDDMAENIDELVDIRQLFGSLLPRERGLLVGLLEQALQEECRFLLRAGIWVGLLLGLVESAIWLMLPSPWLLLAGAVVISVAVLWVPRILLFRYSPRTDRLGRDQWRMAQVLAQRLAGDVLSLRRLMQFLLSGPRANHTRTLIKRHMRPLLDAGLVRTTIQLFLGVEAYAHIKQLVVDRAITLTMDRLSDSDFNQERGGGVRDICVQRLEAMSPAELRELVRPVLDEGWWIQLVAGAAMGLLLGLLQVFLLYII